MAEEIDPFEAAMSAMNDLENLDQAKEEPAAEASEPAEPAAETPVTDPFEAAKEAMESGGDSAASETPASDDPFESAMAAMDAVSSDDVSAADIDIGGSGDDPFAAALEVAKKDEKTPATQPKKKYFEEQEIDLDFLMDIKLNITFEVGRTKMFISDLLSLGQGSVLELHRLVGEELDLFINGELLATGEVVVVNEKFGARIVQILSPEDRINRLAPTLKK